ncbi:endogenous retrovirus group K member 9 Env polyprotein [Lagopus leucura]|uniref:endogenous retrovirus group K member 9 Env polyprotein n=1 Tax=Lagopus leucura TaxID=30410 RepID=UPI001C67E7C1|nr:endogenous retrovirus group K member 9 Env polyprotein [Lagopus leucura]
MPKTRMGELRRKMQRLTLTQTWERKMQERIRLMALILSTLWILHHGCNAETYRAFVPNPPIIHPVTWDEPVDIPVYNNQTMFMGQYSDGHIIEFSARFNYSGKVDGMPICFQMNQTQSLCEKVVVQQDWDTNVSTGIHWALNFLYIDLAKGTRGSGTPPLNFPLCQSTITPKTEFAPLWRACQANETVCIDSTICDWNMIGNQGRPINLVSGIWTKNNHTFYSNLWKAVAAMEKVKAKRLNLTWIQINNKWAMTAESYTTEFYMRACVPEPYAFLSGPLNIVNSIVSCTDCVISNCLNSSSSSFLLVKQPNYVYLPVNLTHYWYADKGMEILQEASLQLIERSKRMVGLIIAGIAALIAAIAVTTVASISLTTSIQTAAYVNELSVNVSKALQNQATWDEKIELRLNSLKDTVDILGRQLQIIATRESHAEYRAICVTPVEYNNTKFSWNKIQDHLQGVWNNANTSLDLRELRQHIHDMIRSHHIDLSVATQTTTFISALKSAFPSFKSFRNEFMG